MNKKNYNSKIEEQINDGTKFVKIEKDPSNQLTTEINKLITTINAVAGNNLSKISGHFEPSYIYGNPKTHKDMQNPPLRPIVSQVGTVTYETGKWLN